MKMIFSHGFGVSPESYIHLLTAWTKLGFQVHPMIHQDARLLEGKTPAQKKLITQEALSSPMVLNSRLKDLKFFMRLFPNEKFILAGHSYGAYTMMVASGIEAKWELSVEEIDNDRIEALVVLSPPGLGERGLIENSWRSFEKPLLSIYGNQDYGVNGQDPMWRHASYALTPHDSKMETIVNGDHYCFMDTKNKKVRDVVQESTSLFLDRFVESESAEVNVS